MKFVRAMEPPIQRLRLSMQNAEQAPGEDHLDSQLIDEEIDTISRQSRRMSRSV